MRKVEKDFDNPPEGLLACATIHKKGIELKGRNYPFDDTCWRNVVTKLRSIYHNKCAFCETPIMPFDYHSDSGEIRMRFTVDHFRPKVYYYWLAYEWSNLLPLCKICNNDKGDKFPFIFKNPYGLMNKMYSLKHPQTAENELDLALCRANHPDLLAENASVLHPEIDEPELFLSFKTDGEIKFLDKKLEDENDDAYNIRQKRAKDTIAIAKLDRFDLNTARLKLINDKKNELDNILTIFFQYATRIESDTIAIAFFPFFKGLSKMQERHQPFSLLGKTIFENFDAFFIQPYRELLGDDTADLLYYALLEFTTSET
jgi:uncharacterized protein (TIGR02646 family)